MKGSGQKLILDCDPGHDDAIAFLVAAAFGRLVGVTTVVGNADVGTTTRNAEQMAAFLGFAGPVIAGAARPLVRDPGPFSPAPFPRYLGPARRASAERESDAASFIARHADSETWLVATGPLTNVALALRRDPMLCTRLAGVAVMGGSTSVGNVTPVAEFNIWADPEAAHIVLTSQLRVRMCGLDVTHGVLVDHGLANSLRDGRTEREQFVGQLLEIYIDTYPDAFVGQGRAPLHDPCAVLAVTHPHLFAWESLHVAVELNGALTRGMTVIDRRGGPARRSPNVEVATSGDGHGILAAIQEAITCEPGAPARRAAAVVDPDRQ
jgi:inosine-uridine nucleoside N-ribohydrolase